MLAFLKTHARACRTILVEKTDRLYRNIKDWATLDELGVTIHFVKENVIISPDARSADQFLHGIKVLMARNYSQNLGEETLKGMTEKARAGIYPSFAPVGYQNVDGPNGKRIIAPHRDEAPIISDLFARFATGNRRVRQKLHANLLKMDPGEFEDLVGRLLAELGFEGIEVTRRSGDGGIDVRGRLVVGDVIATQMAVQVKRWKTKNHVQAPVVQQVRGSLGTHEQGLIITTSDFSPGAKREAERPNAVPVALMNGEKLVELLAEYQVGIRRQAHDLFELEEEEPDIEGAAADAKACSASK
jgi:HJR/Mrr/RecB family endonuclease